MYLDHTYFTGRLSLPNLKYSGTASGVAATARMSLQENNLDYFIAIYESQFLDELLGETLAANMIEGLSADTVDAIWSELKGKIYYVVDGIKLSPAANYVYFHYKRDHGHSTTAMLGEVEHKQTHATNVTDSVKLVDAWNSMCRMIRPIREYLRDNWDSYSPYADRWSCACREQFKPINMFGI